MTKIVSIGNMKGGSGKTTSVFNLAGVLAKEGRRVLLIDVDMQANLTYNCGIDITNRKAKTIRLIFENSGADQPAPQEVIVKHPMKALPSLDIIPSSIFLFKTSEAIYTYPNREMILTRYFAKHRSFFEQYDYILCDTSPTMNALNMNCHLLADNIVLCTDLSINGLVGAQLFCELYDETRTAFDKEDNIAAVSVQNFNGNSTLSRDFMEKVNSDDFSRDIILKTVIKSSVKVKEAELMHLPICIVYPDHPVTKLYEDLVAELREREVL